MRSQTLAAILRAAAQGARSTADASARLQPSSLPKSLPWSTSVIIAPAAHRVVTSCGHIAASAGSAGSHGTEGDELGDLKPGMTMSEEEDDEAEHYSVRARVHRRRLKQRDERHLDEEQTPDEEAPGEEAYKEPGPLLPPDEDEEDVVTDEEEEARK